MPQVSTNLLMKKPDDELPFAADHTYGPRVGDVREASLLYNWCR